MASRPDGDVWNIVDNDKDSQHYGRNFKFDFSYISSEEIKDVVKDYVWQNYRVGNKSLSSLYNEVKACFFQFIRFADTRNITSLKGLTNTDVDHFISYLHTTISERTKKPFGTGGQRVILNTLKSIIRWCQLHRPNDVPVTEIFTGNEYIGVNRKLKIDFIPDDVVAQINEALKTEENPYLKYGIIILQSTGMRIGDLLKLRIDCIKPHLISGYTIEWTQHKSRKNKVPMPVRSECVAAIEKLIEITADLRDKCVEKDKDILLINTIKSGNQYGSEAGKICAISQGTFQWWLETFIRDNNIKDANGDYYNLTSHQFRRTLGTDMLSKGTNINVIQQVLGHSDPSVTKRFYADVKDKERAEVFKSVGVIGNINQIQSSAFDNVSELWNTKKSMRTNKTKPIPEDVFDKILYHAVHDEKDALTKAGIIIQSQTGLRINEVLSIQEGCVKRTSDGYDYMEVTLGKTEKGEPIIHKVFINGLVKNAIAELTEHTAELRKESGLKELFLCRIKSQNNKIAPYTETHWNDKKLRYFIERHDIRDNKGDLYPLTSHQFRSTFVRELIKRKVPIAMIMKQYSHISIEMTAHYLTLQEEEVKEIYSDMILSPESKIAGLRAKEIKGKLDDLFHGKTEDEIDDVISGLAKTMSFNPLPTGVCLYDFRRGNCTDGDGCFFYNCPNYITEVQFYPILKDELDLLEKEMARLKELGQEPAYQVQAVKYKYLKPLVESLEVQLNGKESVG